MKVIAHVNAENVHVEAHIDELARILGVESAWHMRDNGYHAQQLFPIGKVVNVNKLWSVIEHERARPKEIASTVRNLRALADMLESVNQALPTPSVDEPKAESGAQPA